MFRHLACRETQPVGAGFRLLPLESNAALPPHCTKGQWTRRLPRPNLTGMNRSPSASVGDAPRPLNIAIIDDDEGVRRSLSRLLLAAGMNPSSYASAEQFLEYTTQALVDCLVVDVHLGGMSGFDLQRHLALTGTAPPVIFITADDRAGIREQARLVRCAACLTKPVSGESLLAAINEATIHHRDLHRTDVAHQ